MAFLKRGVKVDLSCVEITPTTVVSSLWTDAPGGRVKNAAKYNACTGRTTARVPFQWYDVKVRVPVPLDDYLTSFYGDEYMTPRVRLTRFTARR